MKKSYIPYAILSFAVMISGIFIARGNLLRFWDPASFMLVFVPTIFLLMAVFGPRGIVNAFRFAMHGSEASRSEIQKGIVLFAAAQNIILMTGLIATLMGVIMILDGVSRTPAAPVAFWCSVALASTFYSLMTILIVITPFKAALQKKLAGMG